MNKTQFINKINNLINICKLKNKSYVICLNDIKENIYTINMNFNSNIVINNEYIIYYNQNVNFIKNLYIYDINKGYSCNKKNKMLLHLFESYIRKNFEKNYIFEIDENFYLNVPYDIIFNIINSIFNISCNLIHQGE